MVALALLPVPILQHLFGLLPFIGEAWMATAYLLGLLLALHTGALWEASSPGQAMDALALSLGVAGVLSVGIQLMQWLNVGNLWLSGDGGIGWRVWIVDFAGGRPYANLSQPNMLGTLLLWSVLSAAWGVYRRIFGVATGVMLALFLLFGVALTQSRTAWLGVATLVAASWYWPRSWSSRWTPVVVSMLGAFFAIVTVLLVLGVDGAYQLGAWEMESSRVEAGLRPAAWWLFMDAALAEPWFGYGWSQGMVAQLAVAENHPRLFGVFSHAHNLFLDLVLWCGIPIGLLVSVLLVLWCIDKFRRVKAAGDAIALLFLAVIGIHAMLEFPLHHAYFLLPAGVIAGTLDARLGETLKMKVKVGRTPVLVLGVAAAMLLAVIFRDYIGRIEPNFQAMRFESQRIGNLPKAEAPDVLVLTHLREWLRLARFEPHAGMSDQDIRWLSGVAQRNPTPLNLLKLAKVMAINGRPQEAARWLLKARQVVAAGHWQEIQSDWSIASKSDPRMAAIPLPP